MDVDGQCHCGAIRFKAEINPKRVGICHCTDCQTFSGSAFRTSVMVAGSDFQLLAGEPKLYEKTAESGSLRLLAFCSRCGTHVYGTTHARIAGKSERIYSLRVGTLKQRAELPPLAQVWCRSALDWVNEIGSVHPIDSQ